MLKANDRLHLPIALVTPLAGEAYVSTILDNRRPVQQHAGAFSRLLSSSGPHAELPDAVTWCIGTGFAFGYVLN